MPSTFSYLETKELIFTPKIILDDHGNECREKSINIVSGMKESINLKSIDEEFSFKWSITHSSKDHYRLSLHVLDKDTFIGLFRVDYVPETIIHPNPQGLNDDVPNELKKYVSMDICGPHAHFNVRGYKELTWALPLREINNLPDSLLNEDGNIDLSSPIMDFATYIQIHTTLKMQTAII